MWLWCHFRPQKWKKVGIIFAYNVALSTAKESTYIQSPTQVAAKILKFISIYFFLCISGMMEIWKRRNLVLEDLLRLESPSTFIFFVKSWNTAFFNFIPSPFHQHLRVRRSLLGIISAAKNIRIISFFTRFVHHIASSHYGWEYQFDMPVRWYY